MSTEKDLTAEEAEGVRLLRNDIANAIRAKAEGLDLGFVFHALIEAILFTVQHQATRDMWDEIRQGLIEDITDGFDIIARKGLNS